ncbi:MAG: hypothetical protein IPM32_00775 [Ignavibacteriae bacterium]|nr:hypothetical protein [Ignavibacteriota bacterium]
MERPKLELDINQPSKIRLLFDEAIVGESQYGKYYLYAVSNGNNKEYSFFAPDIVHEKLKDYKKGTEAIITKIAAQRGKKLVTSYDVQIIEVQNSIPATNQPQNNPYLENMLASFADALVVQEKFNGMANVNQIAITMFIQRTKGNGFAHE